MKKREKIYIGALLLTAAVAFGIYFLGTRTLPEAEANQFLGKKNSETLKPFTLKTFDGSELDIMELKGSPIVINFWGSWCPPCRREASDVEATYRAFKAKGVNFVGIAVQDLETEAMGFINEYDVTYPNGLDHDESIMSLYKVFVLPMTIIVDKKGFISFTHVGPITKKRLSAAIRELL